MRFIPADDRAFVPASHEDPQKPGVWKRVLAARDEMLPGHPQMINWARLPIGARFQRHYHEDMEEIFIMVQGTAEMQVESEQVRLNPGDTLVVAPRETHSMTNIGNVDVEYVVVGISLDQGGQTVVVE